MKVPTLSPRIASAASAKRTASRTCRTQYEGSVTSSETGPPVKAETIVIVGTWYVTWAIVSANWSSIGSISGEWKACET